MGNKFLYLWVNIASSFLISNLFCLVALGSLTGTNGDLDSPSITGNEGSQLCSTMKSGADEAKQKGDSYSAVAEKNSQKSQEHADKARQKASESRQTFQQADSLQSQAIACYQNANGGETSQCQSMEQQADQLYKQVDKLNQEKLKEDGIARQYHQEAEKNHDAADVQYKGELNMLSSYNEYCRN